jgi:hypothetical protein
MELAASSRNFITIQRVSPSHTKINIAIQFFNEASTNHATNQESTVGWDVTKEVYQRKPPFHAQKGNAERFYQQRLCASFQGRQQHKSVHIASKCKGDDTPTLTLPLIECLIKVFKTNHAPIEFDAGFVNGFGDYCIIAFRLAYGLFLKKVFHQSDRAVF